MKILIKEKKNTIACLAIGEKIYRHWKKNIYPFWKIYCKKNNLGLVVFTKDLIDKKNSNWKKPTWQRLLVGQEIKKTLPLVKNVCILDLDILINPIAPNIFNSIKKNKINLTSLRTNLPFEYKNTIRKLAFFRKKYTNKNYPLDSSLNSSLKTLYQADGLKSQDDELCVGVLVYNIKNFSKTLYDWFFYFKKKNMKTNFGGCQNQIAYKILTKNYCHLLSYKFQAIWVFEIAARFPIIMKYLKNLEIMSEMVTSTILDNYFLHFAGAGPEASIWMKSNFFNRINKKLLSEYNNYYLKKLEGRKLYKKNPKK
ncbi:hypothetical protein N9419_02490 [Candidatus Pelagibacter sp.]|jgi:hypothetical protein|nr:hypothetical protein [Candidatus Pelagibacter sp.]